MMDKTLKRIGIILLAGAVVAGLANCVHPRKIPWVQNWARQVEERAAKQKIKVIPLSVALEKHRARASVFIDARSTEDFEKGHIAGAVPVPFESFEESFPTLAELIDSEKELVVYCTNRECDDALMLANELKAMGATNLLLYVDGFELWEKHGGEVER